MTDTADDPTRASIAKLGSLLVDQHRARIIVPPERSGAGHWFGSGNLSVGPDGALYLCGRYRNFGDSRTGLGKGERGKELAVFRSTDGAGTFEKLLSFSKRDLSYGDITVLSIEGSHLHFHENGVSLYIATEKDGIGYPEEVSEFHKPGTGVWTIDRIDAASVELLDPHRIRPFASSRLPAHLHVKDPFVFTDSGSTYVGYCTHPFTWASSNTAFHVDDRQVFDVFPRGPAWDVAVARMTCYAPVPRVGAFADTEQHYICFYDGAECVRSLDAHPEAVKRPRGYSCEEIGGLAVARASNLLVPQRVSVNEAAFTSPWGTGCSRYVDVLFTEEYAYATWQQSQPDQSQPLVMNRVPMSEVEDALR
ncbi:MAG: exo-alpha-sialidase [Spirochaetota bacterium]